jgi:hypothetical protein
LGKVAREIIRLVISNAYQEIIVEIKSCYFHADISLAFQ